MATYSGSQGIQALRAKIKNKSKQLISEAVTALTVSIVEASPVGVEYYTSKIGAVFNDVGDFKNSWSVGFDAPDSTTRAADASGAGAISSAIMKSKTYNLQPIVYITNSVSHAGNVEHGWKENPIYGWKAKDGYHVVENHKSIAVAVLVTTALKVSRGI